MCLIVWNILPRIDILVTFYVKCMRLDVFFRCIFLMNDIKYSNNMVAKSMSAANSGTYTSQIFLNSNERVCQYVTLSMSKSSICREDRILEKLR